MSEVQEAAVAVETPEVTTVGKKKKKAETGNLIFDVAQEVETLTKTKALNEASRLAEDIETNYFRLGGVLKLINDNSWFEGFDSFDAYVLETHGFASRKARYLIQIYDNLVSKQIPWDKVSGLGWTKLKDLAPILTSENVDEWVDKASKLTVLELQSVLKAAASGNPDSTANTTADVVRVVFKLKGDQAEALQGALAKAKGELNTEFDSVAIENIALAYLGDVIKAPSLEDFVKKQDFMALMNVISAAYPQYMITVEDAPSESQA